MNKRGFVERTSALCIPLDPCLKGLRLDFRAHKHTINMNRGEGTEQNSNSSKGRDETGDKGMIIRTLKKKSLSGVGGGSP